jgi:hypothetical protein
MFALAAGILLSTSVSTTEANPAQQNSLYRGCKALRADDIRTDANSGLEQGLCLGIIEALLNLGKHVAPPSQICVPDGTTLSQAIDVVIAYIENNPDKLRLQFAALAHLSLQDAFPCPGA